MYQYISHCVLIASRPTTRYSARCDSAELRLEKFYPEEDWELSDSDVRDRWMM